MKDKTLTPKQRKKLARLTRDLDQILEFSATDPLLSGEKEERENSRFVELNRQIKELKKHSK